MEWWWWWPESEEVRRQPPYLLPSSVAGDDQTPPPPSPGFQPAYAVNNIKNLISITLDQEEGQYATWVERFHIQACAYNVLDHIDASVSRPSDIDDATWTRLDAIVKGWIYSTISKDLVHAIMKQGATALQLWTRLEHFANMEDYCKEIKLLADQLSNVDNPVSDRKMVLQLISGLTKGEYDTVAALISQTEPTPSFIKARSMFLLEETRKSKQEEHGQQALMAQQPPTAVAAPSPPPPQHSDSQCGGAIRGGRGRGRGQSKNGKGRGRGRTTNPSSSHQPNGPQYLAQQAPQWGGQPTWQQQQPG
ncbi:uncharacterized protein LOC110698267 [Chenopodium quinoa]|uniref:uncharacterized protein LOC110698267 n=1 Tax=Chenopodium quinoa TaxID=63459 RepID=UPI000B76C34F|nr:uncharacterized protein LOC110698267 [Chenopodium quinoa]